MNPAARDEIYNLTSVLYHALQGVETAQQYRKDAQEAGDTELMAFFDEVRTRNLKLAEDAKEHLRTCLARGADHPDGRPARPMTKQAKSEEASRESFPASDAPSTY